MIYEKYRQPFDVGALNRVALSLRKSVAREFGPEFSDSGLHDRNNGHFELFKNKLPFSDVARTIAFGDFITERALEAAKDIATSVEHYVYLAAKLVEQRFYIFIDPNRPEKHHTNLSVAKHYGTFFTPPSVARLMAEQLLTGSHRSAVIDPCCGSGVLLAEVMIVAAERGVSLRSAVGVELDGKTSYWASRILKHLHSQLGATGNVEVVNGDALDVFADTGKYGDHDIIINPPYGRIRFQRNRITNNETRIHGLPEDLEQHSMEFEDHYVRLRHTLRTALNGLMPTGMLEWSQIFFRMCAKRAEEGSKIVIISPDSWLSSIDAGDLRGRLIERRALKKLYLYPENAKLFATVNQPTAVALIAPGVEQSLEIVHMGNEGSQSIEVSFEDLKALSGGRNLIPRISGKALEVYRRLSVLPSLGLTQKLINARGELDQTVHKNLYIGDISTLPLVRGEHITRYCFLHQSSESKPGFLDPVRYARALGNKPKAAHLRLHRIVGRQCSYMSQRRRLYFAIVPPGHVVGNSCNYITFADEDAGEPSDNLFFLLGVLNSSVLDWYFRILNSNNHVGNYELAKLPVPPRGREYATQIASLAKILCECHQHADVTRAEWVEVLQDAFVAAAFELDSSSLALIHADYDERRLAILRNYVRSISLGNLPRIPISGTAFNHEPPSLSALDMDMIRSVPEGGNWQQIPLTIPSKRLQQIREMSAERGVVRTTYYGRLRRDQPAYTISTYFDRPGNGTHIHPVLDRTLTSREAARLQSFPDSYLFLGSPAAVRTQIGNAVPPLLAYAIGSRLSTFASRELTCVDVFCGAGGLSLGLERAGWNVVAAVDNDAAALQTYGFNRPCTSPDSGTREGTTLLKFDLHEESAIDASITNIRLSLGKRDLDLLVGGPPCQGFSHAGFRHLSDKRNDLAAVYLRMTEVLKPKIFLLENVEGLITFKRGQVIREIIETLEDLGYYVSKPVWRLSAEEYGVPQMRRRVFVVATLNKDVRVEPPSPTHLRCLGRRKNLNAVASSSVLPPPVTVSEALSELSLTKSIDNEQWLQWINMAHYR